MNKQIIIGCLLSIIILLIVPTMPALQYSMAKEARIDKIYKEIIENPLSKNYFHKKSIQDFISKFISTEHMTKSSWTKIHSDDEKVTDSQEEPLFFPFLGIFIYLLIFYIIYLIISIVLGKIFNFAGQIVNNIKSKIQNLIETILTVVITIVTFVLMLIEKILQVLAAIGNGILNGLTYVLYSVWYLIAFIFQGIFILLILAVQGVVSLLRSIWIGLGTFLRLIIDIFNLIIDTIFPQVIS